jgi:PAS domain S-box-containing protein
MGRRAVSTENGDTSKAQLRAIIDFAVDAIITIDEEGIIRTFNAAAVSMFGYAAEEAVGRNVSMLMPEPYRGEHDGYLQRYRKTGEAHFIGSGREVLGRRKNGQTIPIDVAVSEITTAGIRLFTSIIRDITERKKAEWELLAAKEAAEEANRTKTRFLANMSHELRTPLNAIIGFSQMTRDQIHGLVGNERYLEYAIDINESGKHLLAIISDILDLTAVEAGKMELNAEPMGLAAVIDASVQVTAQRAKHGRVRVSISVEKDTPMIVADKLRMKQIVINLLSNAIKFTPEDGEVTIHTEVDEKGCLHIIVRDTGIGMDEDGLTTAMEPFGQAEGALSGKFEGTGLGLPLTRRLVEAHGGVLEIESRPRMGTTVTVCLPAERVVH